MLRQNPDPGMQAWFKALPRSNKKKYQEIIARAGKDGTEAVSLAGPTSEQTSASASGSGGGPAKRGKTLKKVSLAEYVESKEEHRRETLRAGWLCKLLP